MPASPSTSTTCGWPQRAAAAAASSTASSSARPTNTPPPGGPPPRSPGAPPPRPDPARRPAVRPTLSRVHRVWRTGPGRCQRPAPAWPPRAAVASRPRWQATPPSWPRACGRRQGRPAPPPTADRWRPAAGARPSSSHKAWTGSPARGGPPGKAPSTPSTVSPAAASSAVKAVPKSARLTEYVAGMGLRSPEREPPGPHILCRRCPDPSDLQRLKGLGLIPTAARVQR